MSLDNRTELGDGRCTNVVHVDDAMRITHRYGGDPDGPAVDVQRVVALFRISDERDLCRLESRDAHVDRNAAVVLQLRIHGAGRGVEREPAVGRFVSQQFGDAAQAIAALLYL